MDRKAEQVLKAVKALVQGALPHAEVTRNKPDASRVPPGGAVNIVDGDPGEPEVDLSPVVYHYQHRIPLELTAYASATLTREEVVDAMLQPIGAAVAADPTLGGLCDYLEAEAPTSEDFDLLGARPGRQVDVTLVAHYATTNPLA